MHGARKQDDDPDAARCGRTEHGRQIFASAQRHSVSPNGLKHGGMDGRTKLEWELAASLLGRWPTYAVAGPEHGAKMRRAGLELTRASRRPAAPGQSRREMVGWSNLPVGPTGQSD